MLELGAGSPDVIVVLCCYAVIVIIGVTGHATVLDSTTHGLLMSCVFSGSNMICKFFIG